MNNYNIPKLLTFIGILPFIVITAGLWLDMGDRSMWGAALVSYAVMILSFIGGIHWGLALTSTQTGTARKMMFIESSVFVFAGWVVALSPIILPYKLIGLMILYGNIWVADKLYARRLSLPEWFLQARSVSTIIVMLCLVLAAGATI